MPKTCSTNLKRVHPITKIMHMAAHSCRIKIVSLKTTARQLLVANASAENQLSLRISTTDSRKDMIETINSIISSSASNESPKLATELIRERPIKLIIK